MKTTILSFFLAFVVFLGGYSQSFSLADDFGPIANGATVVQRGPSDTLHILTWLHLTNHSENSLQVLMKKQEVYMSTPANASICWAGYCFGPETTTALFPLLMNPGDTVEGCFGHFAPYGTRGVSTIRWTFFDQSNVNDSISVTVNYSIFPTAVAENSDLKCSLTFAGPVPANDHLPIKYFVPQGKQGRIDLRNSSGQIISFRETQLNSGTIMFNTANLSSGQYLLILSIDGTPVVIKKAFVLH
jgi:hypothetical protein